MVDVKEINFSSDQHEGFQARLLAYLSTFETAILLDSNITSQAPVPVTGVKYNFLGGAGVLDEVSSETHSLDELQRFLDIHRARQNFVFGYFSYDLKNNFEKLTSKNPDHTQFPLWHFFVPKILITSNKEQIKIQSSELPAAKIFEQIQSSHPLTETGDPGTIVGQPDKQHYLQTLQHILKHIHLGDIYEMNYCNEIRLENCTLNPALVFSRLTAVSPNPFSAYYQNRHHALACASPERFITSKGNRIISQPMKGTMPRGVDSEEDERFRQLLLNNAKERSENVMITDLVRNDLSRIAATGSVKVEELFGVYAFKKSFQMITTVSCETKDAVPFTDIIRAMFPMGSMTGAPKIRAMELIEKYENFQRGIFSGSIGYIDPSGDFDFNVIIRSIIMNIQTRRASIAAGGAITSGSDPEKEYEEMMLKITPQLNVIAFTKL